MNMKEGAKVNNTDLRKARNARKQSKRAKKGASAADALVVERVVVVDPDARSRLVDRAVDTVELLWRRGQIDARQRQAAETYRDASAACSGGLPCALDISRVGGGSGRGSPSEAALWGARVLAQAEAVLGRLDGRLVRAVVAEGRSIEEVARSVFGAGKDGKARRPDSEHMGRRLRLALTALADDWWPLGRRRIRGAAADRAAAALEAAPKAIEPGRVAHATRHRVRYSQREA